MCCRIVVVGASTTGLTAVQKLLQLPQHKLAHITLLAPQGGHAASAPVSAQLAALEKDSRVTVMDASVVALDRCALADF